MNSTGPRGNSLFSSKSHENCMLLLRFEFDLLDSVVVRSHSFSCCSPHPLPCLPLFTKHHHLLLGLFSLYYHFILCMRAHWTISFTIESVVCWPWYYMNMFCCIMIEMIWLHYDTRDLDGPTFQASKHNWLVFSPWGCALWIITFDMMYAWSAEYKKIALDCKDVIMIIMLQALVICLISEICHLSLTFQFNYLCNFSQYHSDGRTSFLPWLTDALEACEVPQEMRMLFGWNKNIATLRKQIIGGLSILLLILFLVYLCVCSQHLSDLAIDEVFQMFPTQARDNQLPVSQACQEWCLRNFQSWFFVL